MRRVSAHVACACSCLRACVYVCVRVCVCVCVILEQQAPTAGKCRAERRTEPRACLQAVFPAQSGWAHQCAHGSAAVRLLPWHYDALPVCDEEVPLCCARLCCAPCCCAGATAFLLQRARLLQRAITNGGRLFYEKGEKGIVHTHGIPVHCEDARSRGSSGSVSP